MPAYYSNTSASLDRFFGVYGDYIEEIEYTSDPTRRFEIKVKFSRYKEGCTGAKMVHAAAAQWDAIQRMIAEGAIDILKAVQSCEQFMKRRSYPSISARAYEEGFIRFDKEKPFTFDIQNAFSENQWWMANTILGKDKEMTPKMTIMNIEKVVFNGPATIILWKDKTKTVVKCMEGDTYDPEKAVLLACLEHTMGGKAPAKKWLKKMTEGAPRKPDTLTEDVPIGMSRKEEQAEFDKIKFQFRHKKFKEFVDNRAAMTGMDELEFMDIMNCFIHYTRKTALDWYDGVKPISDTAWKKICEAYPDILEDNNA